VARSLAAPGEIFAHSGYRLGLVALSQRYYGRAMAEGERLLAGPLPDSLKAAALLLVGESSYRGRQFEAVRSAYERFLLEFRGRPEAPLAAASLGWAELRLGRGAEARKGWDAFAADYPGHAEAPNALILAAELAWKEGSADEALGFLDRLVSQSPSSRHVEPALLDRALLLLKGARAEEASHGLRELLVRAPTMKSLGRVHLAYGVALVNLRDGAGAEAQFQAALREGDDPVARLGLGWASWLVGAWEAAHQSFTRARVERDPELRQLADYGLAVTYAQRGAYGEFKSQASAFLRTSPRHPAAPALVYLMTGKAIEAGEWGEAGRLALRLATDYPDSSPADDALFRVGEATEKAGESRISRDAYRTLIDRYRKSPYFEQTRQRLGHDILKSGDQQAAKPLLSGFVAANPKDPRLPEVLMELGRSQESLARFEKQLP
jgi:TolA-binding protein